MTLNQYLKATGKATDWPYMQPAERNKIADDYIREAHKAHREPSYSFQMPEDTQVENAATCRAAGCENVAFKNGDGLCPWCYEEHEGLKAAPKTPPMSHLKWIAIYLAIALGGVLLAIVIGAFFAGVEGR